jgi:hypothetical protein
MHKQSGNVSATVICGENGLSVILSFLMLTIVE